MLSCDPMHECAPVWFTVLLQTDLDNVCFLQGVGEEIGVFIITCIALEKEKKTFLREFRFLTGVNDKQIFHLLFYLPADWKKFLHASFWVLFFLKT